MKRLNFKIAVIFICLMKTYTGYSSGMQQDSAVYVPVDKHPEFKYKNCTNTNGCVQQFITEHLTWPDVENDFYVKVFVQCIVEKDGSLSDIKIIKKGEDWFDKKAIEIVSLMPRWTPGVKNGKHVRTQIMLPVVWNR